MPKFRHNPDLDTTDLTEKALPGGAAYVATRFLTYATYKIAANKAPTMAKHIAVGASVAAAGLAWAFGHRVKQLEKYYEPILVGTSVAAVQGILQSYVPQYSYFVNNYLNDTTSAAAGAPTVTQPVAASDYDSLLDDFEEMPLGLPSGSVGPAPAPPAQMDTSSFNQFDPLSDFSDND